MQYCGTCLVKKIIAYKWTYAIQTRVKGSAEFILKALGKVDVNCQLWKFCGEVLVLIVCGLILFCIKLIVTKPHESRNSCVYHSAPVPGCMKALHQQTFGVWEICI